MTDRSTDPEFTPISPNPYIVGNPVRDPSMFFGREAEFDFVRSRIQDATAQARGGLLLVFCGERRSGKTSILFQILDHRLGTEYIPVLIDMQSMAVGSEVEFLTRVCEEVLAALGPGAGTVAPPQFTSDSRHAATFRKFIQDVLRAHPDKRLILLFDEYELFENKIDAGHLSRDVLLILANLMEHERVFLIFTGSQHIGHRRRDYWEKFLPKSLFKTISFLEREDATNLVRMPVEGRVRYVDGAVEAIYRLTAGQPFYTQAICQNLVDDLNDKHASLVTREAVTEVVDRIVNNPLPQMIFLWDALDRDEKLVLALLAECLGDETAFAGYEEIRRMHSQRRYRLGIDEARIAPALEKLFKGEMLHRNDSGGRSVYAFRMDLWRLWIRRQHSVWQVVRELGIIGRRPPFERVPIGGRIAIGVGIASILALVTFTVLRGRKAHAPGGALVTPLAQLIVEPVPDDATVYMDDEIIGPGTFRDMVPAGTPHKFRLAAAGYADTQVVRTVAPGGFDRTVVRLRALLGSLRVETRPAGADITVDGAPRGRSPVTISGLLIARSHRVEAALSGHDNVQRDLILVADSVVSLPLERGKIDVYVVTSPAECDIRVDGNSRGTSPLTLAGLWLGPHRISAAHEGYVSRDTTVDLRPSSRELQMRLERESPGFLIIQGDQLVDIYVNDTRVRKDNNNSGRRQLPPGAHHVIIEFKNDTPRIDTTIVVRSGELAVYDFSKGTVNRQFGGGSKP